MSAPAKTLRTEHVARKADLSTQRTGATVSSVMADSTNRGSAWRRIFSPGNVFFLICAVVVYAGWRSPLHRYITPQTGLGYALGILGGSLMLILLLYPARKRARWLAFMGTVKHWFQIHMVLGILGPICILFHSNFSTGATNSNVALFCMLIVSASGLVGRYFYSKIHHGLYGHEATLNELQAHAERLRTVASSAGFLQDLLDRVDIEEKALLQQVSSRWMLLRPFSAAWNCYRVRGRLTRYARNSLRSRAPAASHAQQQRLMKMAQDYIAARSTAARRIAEYQSYAQLFSLWHILHLPLFFMLLIAGIVHVIAVHVY